MSMDENLPIVSDVMDTLWDEPSHPSGKKLKLAKVPKFDREEQAKSVVRAYHAMGGDARFAHWAHEYPAFFYSKIWSKLLPSQAQVHHEGSINVVYRPAIPPSPLDGDQPPVVLSTTKLEEDLRSTVDAAFVDSDPPVGDELADNAGVDTPFRRGVL